MRTLVFSLLLSISVTAYADPEEESITPLKVLEIYDSQVRIPSTGLVNVLEREEKIKACIFQYIEKQTKSFSKIAQNNLYDLIHNFDKIASRIYGKKTMPDGMTHEQKLEALAISQCEIYFSTGVLK